MQWASASSEDRTTEVAMTDVSERLIEELGGPPDVAFLFLSPHHAPAYDHVPRIYDATFGDGLLLGCSGGGVIGGGRELEHRPSLSITAARLPGARISPLRTLATAPGSEGLAAALGSDTRGVVLLTDPFACDADGLVAELDRALPGVPKVGGIASGGGRPRSTVLFLGEGVHRDGAVGVALAGEVTMDTVVAQGCRPIGEPMIITRVEGNTILELDAGRPLDVLRALHGALGSRDQALFGTSLFLGIEMKDQRVYAQGDFLVRHLLGVDPDNGALAVSALPQRHQVVQFHLRDAVTSAEDLDACLVAYGQGHPTPPAGALLFSCLGRGEGLYGTVGHDTKALARHLGPLPVGGFFCNGEIGPVGGVTFVHGYTSAIGLFRGA